MCTYKKPCIIFKYLSYQNTRSTLGIIRRDLYMKLPSKVVYWKFKWNSDGVSFNNKYILYAFRTKFNSSGMYDKYSTGPFTHTSFICNSHELHKKCISCVHVKFVRIAYVLNLNFICTTYGIRMICLGESLQYFEWPRLGHYAKHTCIVTKLLWSSAYHNTFVISSLWFLRTKRICPTFWLTNLYADF